MTVLETKEQNDQHEGTIFVVDDDPGVSRAMASVGRLLGHPVVAFASADQFLKHYDPDVPGCLVLDVRLPGMTGLELQKKLASDPSMSLPIIMISGHADVRIAVEAMSHGAVTLLEKPCRLDELTHHIREALARDLGRRAQLSRQNSAASRLARLTQKEREVFDLVTAGKTNRDIAGLLNLSIRAVEDRRSRLMKKLGVRSIVELVQLHPVTGLGEMGLAIVPSEV